MSGSAFGTIFRVTTFGESHGEGIGAVVDGCPAGMPLDENDLRKELERRKPGQSEFTTPRKEDDVPEILSGVFEGKTTGTPIAIFIGNRNQKSGDYAEIKELFRPGHADYGYFNKYGFRDYRGGGRSSARETAARVAAGAVAKKYLSLSGIEVFGHVVRIGDTEAKEFDKNYIERNPLRTADKNAFPLMAAQVAEASDRGDSVGSAVEIIATGVPVGLGEPVFDKMDARLAYAITGIPAVKGVEFGAGFRAALARGSENNDEITPEGFLSNNAGGILGGITTGQDIVLRFVLKPASSILIPKKTVDVRGNPAEIVTKGRHDPCLAPRAVPVGEAMTALVIADMLLLNRSSKV